MRTVCAILAAGLSRRFGAADKLRAPLRGRALLDHAAGTARALAVEERVIVTVAGRPAPPGFRAVVNPAPERGQGTSLALAAQHADAAGADRLLVLLGDTPFVTPAHARAVMDACTRARPAASVDGGTVMPPACFPRSWFGRLAALDGERGAGALLKGLPSDALVAAEAGALFDIDTPNDLSRLRAGAA